MNNKPIFIADRDKALRSLELHFLDCGFDRIMADHYARGTMIALENVSARVPAGERQTPPSALPPLAGAVNEADLGRWRRGTGFELEEPGVELDLPEGAMLDVLYEAWELAETMPQRRHSGDRDLAIISAANYLRLAVDTDENTDDAA